MTHPVLPRERLHAIPLLKNFTSDEAGQLLGIAETAEFEPGAIVLAEDKESSNLWIVLDGTCEIVKKSDQTGRQVVLAEVQPNQHFGEMSFFHPAPHSASVRAKTAVKLLRVGRHVYDPFWHGFFCAKGG